METDHEIPPRGVAAMARLRWVLIILSATACAFSWWSIAAADPNTATAPRYYCPMHPEVKSHDPGECPICHMTLEPIPEHRKPVSPTKPPAGSASAATSNAPPGTVPIKLSLDRVQAIGVRTALAEASGTTDELRAPAVIEAAESGFAAVHARAAGFIERIAVKETGTKVKAGQELAGLYSPEIYQAQAELLAVGKWVGGADAAATTERVKKKLGLLGVSEAAMKRIVERGEPERTVGLSSPISGFISKKNVVLGSYVTPDTPLFEIIDLSKVYIVANLYPAELSHVKLGTEGTFRPASEGSPSVSAKVDLIYPAVEESARTTRVRLQVKNPDTALTPGEYGTVGFAAPGSKSVMVPRDALIDTGRHTYVFVALGKGRFEPRSVVVGAETGDRLEISHGLEPGESVVSGATFLIDSESRLRASFAESGASEGSP